MSEQRREALQPERWNHSLPKAFNDFKEIDFNGVKFNEPLIQSTEMSNNELLAICLLKDLDIFDSKYTDASLHLEKFRRVFYDSKEGRNWRTENVKGNFREVVSLSIIGLLNPEIRTEALEQLDSSKPAYDIVKDIFKKEK
jgi:hypothetical protein